MYGSLAAAGCRLLRSDPQRKAGDQLDERIGYDNTGAHGNADGFADLGACASFRQQFTLRDGELWTRSGRCWLWHFRYRSLIDHRHVTKKLEQMVPTWPGAGCVRASPRGVQESDCRGVEGSEYSAQSCNTQLNRRQFLKLTSASALTAPLLLHSAGAASAQKGPNDRITLGFIGTGTQGRGLLNNFLAMPDTQVVAVCDVDTTRRDHHRKVVDEFYSIKGNKEYQGCTGYKEFQDLLARKDIDAVVIAVPDHWHAYIAIAACKAGKDVYCEKPLSLTIHEARAMVKAARKNDRVFQTGSMQRSSSEFRKACELVRNGRIGKVKQVIVDVGGPSVPCDLPEEPMEPGLNWDLWLGPAPLRPYNSVLSPRGVHQHFPDWRNYREYSGGGMTDWGAHHFDIAQWGLGMDESGPGGDHSARRP